jgi:hypothetical protein
MMIMIATSKKEMVSHCLLGKRLAAKMKQAVPAIEAMETV